MPSFSSILKFAAVGFAAFASAAPANINVAPNVAGNSINVRHDQEECSSIPAIFTKLNIDLNVALQPIAFVTSANVSVEVVTPAIEEAKSIVAAAIVDVKALVDVKVDTLLATVDGVLSLVDVAGLITAVLTLIFTVIGTVLSVVAAADKEVLAPLLCELLTLVAELIQLVLQLVGGLLAVLLPLILNVVVPVVLNLNLTAVFGFLGDVFGATQGY